MIPQQLLHYTPAPDLFKDRVILVTGATGGIGRALSLALAKHGATVVLLDKVIKTLEKVYDEIEAEGGPQPGIYPMNLEGATAKDYQDLAENLGNEFGRLDGLVHNAGWVGALTPVKLYDLEMWARVITVNLHATFLLTQATLPLLEKAADPAIVFSTQDCQRAYWGAFGVAKAGQRGLLDILAAEYQGARRIRVNGVDTGPVQSQLRADHYPGEDPTQHPEPAEVIGPYLYLLGPDAGETTGQNLKLA
ncbi:3-oxoacyl-ACP reductase [Ectothiorhodospira haloalkaliphila]|uniref:3-oxoacyl-ACP reductase n=1 Tax=Ectothiorhodospira haloalkaliphila TaxID=421628 RepID=W8KR51_9GAMM|nr:MULTISPECIES: SDR family NAD(P)-dependent oxidoreductase [Ectothiorhodospira]AHK79497.1 3-oxoacyl-ACP reductase [Ectothiorhodospira haloalkaliphila]MCG5495139.1 SDR family NAD(P)-dependent oxidoreductase [Ectothiorhodospira variabilis]MCG5498262.1 SDR family NAD(P)-dependent oxidoreductase [Ectothiorhodospira variabilis]MCG5503833.1 SDR family NAD(P)-dependent oxidoreductase [Ectothiorhodospira variabilis]MCG5507036.1 SDR family NAD(P)-dependent oxidoreductase [Ectothiorhodospira variabilis